MEKEKLQIEFNNYKSSTQEVGELMEKAAENSSLRANLEIAKKVSLKLKIYHLFNKILSIFQFKDGYQLTR
jgi:hypothetical protein